MNRTLFCLIALILFYTSALKSEEHYLYGWGSNYWGQLGDGTNKSKNVPFLVNSDKDWVSISCGAVETVALNKDGSLWACGRNGSGQLGDGTTKSKSSLIQIGTDTDWVSISCRQNHTLALKRDGSLWAWGWNSYSQLGDGSDKTKNSPTRIGTDQDWVFISTGLYHSVAIKTDGTLWAWGGNYLPGYLGEKTPTMIGTDSDWAFATCGETHTVALKCDGTLWAWGSNHKGQLGDGTTKSKSTPTRIGNDNDWTSIICGTNRTAALKKDGSLWAWGNNYGGQLGDGTKTFKNIPTRIGADKDWAFITCGLAGDADTEYSHTVAIKKNGSLWAWGKNYYGELGDGTNEDKVTMTRIGSDSCWYSVACGAGHTMGLAKPNIQLPRAEITFSGSTTLCEGESVTLTASQNKSYLWSTGETTQSITVKTTGEYSVTVTNENNYSKQSAPIKVTVNQLPIAKITPNGKTSICDGESVTLTADKSNSYLWNTGGTDQSIVVNSEGDYFVIVTNEFGCSDTSSYTKVTVHKAPEELSIDSLPGDILVARAKSTLKLSYQWYRDGVIIKDATNQNYIASTPSGTHTYYVEVTNECGQSTSETISHTDVIEGQTEANSLIIIPNPAFDYITIEGYYNELKIYDIIGREIISIEQAYNQKIDISSLKPGVYLIKSGSNVAKFIKI